MKTRKPLIEYRFKDTMGCVFFRAFRSDHEAYLWYDRNKKGYGIREFGKNKTVYVSRILDSFAD